MFTVWKCKTQESRAIQKTKTNSAEKKMMMMIIIIPITKYNTTNQTAQKLH